MLVSSFTVILIQQWISFSFRITATSCNKQKKRKIKKRKNLSRSFIWANLLMGIGNYKPMKGGTCLQRIFSIQK